MKNPKNSPGALRPPLWGLAALSIALAACPATRHPRPDGAVVIAQVLPGGAGSAAGLLPGDRIVEVVRRPAPPANPRSVSRVPEDPLSVTLFEIEQAPRGPVELQIERDASSPGEKTRRLTVRLDADDWRVRYGTERSNTPFAKAWDRLREASQHAEAHEAKEAEASYAAAERFAEAQRDERFLALIRQRRTDARIVVENPNGALSDIRSAIEILGRLAPGSLAEAAAWAGLGRLEFQRENLEGSVAALNRARQIQAAEAPGSVALALTENNLATCAGERGDFDGANLYLRSALATAERKVPEGRFTASLYMNLGILARMRARLDEAESYQQRALGLVRRLEPGSQKVPSTLLNLADLAIARGHLDSADDLLDEALRTSRTLHPRGETAANALSQLGSVAERRGDYAEAEARYKEALSILEELAPGGPSVARTLTGLATVANAQGASDRAERYAGRALELQRKIAPGSPVVALDLVNLGEIALARREHRAARARIGEAIRIVEDLPDSLEVAAPLRRAAPPLLALGSPEDLRRAEQGIRRALSIYQRVVPGTAEEADALGLLGQVARRRGRAAEAGGHFARAFSALDRSVRRLGGSDLDATRFRARFARFYREAIDLEVELGRPAEAFRTLERFRARSLLDLLGERDLAPPAELPANLVEQARQIEARLTQLEGEIGALDPATATGRIEALISRRARIFGERENLRARVRRISPRYAAIAAPVPLDAAAARKTLAPLEVALAYSVGEKRTLLFAVLPEGFPGAPAAGVSVAVIPLGREALEREVSAFRSLALAGQGLGGDRPLRARGARLYSSLLAPAAPWLARARRLRISADGPLAALPFAALTAPAAEAAGGGAKTAPPVYLAERWPLSTVLSSTLAAELGRMRGEKPAAQALVAFGDPRYGGRPGPAPARGPRPSVRFRSGLAPLPASRSEVEQVAALLRPARSFLGGEATEARFLSEAPRGRIVHFAGHALLDPRFPLDSALALSVPARPGGPGDDGLLQAWEIFERLRLSADLVTLSACETALGLEAQGEGLQGLTRAFHYAGARTVLSSLWSVSDRSTAELMRRFYAHLGAGEAKDQALAEAQREMLAGTYRHPYHWAAFQLDGDWR